MSAGHDPGARPPPHPYRVRTARADDVDALPAIERAAAALFREVGLDAPWLDETSDAAELLAAQRVGRLWVAVDGADAPVGFAVWGPVDGTPHLEELDVHPAHGRRGLGAALLAAVARQAAAGGATGLTLSTFRDVPWNGPFYARHGFVRLAETELGPGLRARIAEERRRGLPMERRCVLRRALSAPHAAAAAGRGPDGGASPGR